MQLINEVIFLIFFITLLCNIFLSNNITYQNDSNSDFGWQMLLDICKFWYHYAFGDILTDHT